ncbi:MAG TPA: peptidase M22 [Opitutaceae bacterium]|nr:peptidase M22 [Opitutaceae bacterium]
MPSLSQILREHSPLLLIDAASARIQVGILDIGAPARWSARTDEAGVGVFECLDELDADIGSVGAFAFCEGPGSILGIRTSAMALRMWCVLGPRPMFGYVGLAVVARAVGRPHVGIIADARRGLWHHFAQGGRLERVRAAELSGELMMPEGFRHWDPLPPRTTLTSYDMAALLRLPAVAEADLFRATEAPDASLYREPSYAKWTPQIHRAP